MENDNAKLFLSMNVIYGREIEMFFLFHHQCKIAPNKYEINEMYIPLNDE
jgi:hypothetical protein